MLLGTLIPLNRFQQAYAELWRRASVQAGVRYDVPPDNRGHWLGQFNAVGNTIQVFRAKATAFPTLADPTGAPDPLDELATLAHEMGHAESLTAALHVAGPDRDRWLHYFSSLTTWAVLGVANSFRLSLTERRDILEEETRAWALGRAHLEELLPEALEDYDQRANVSLVRYRFDLRLML